MLSLPISAAMLRLAPFVLAAPFGISALLAPVRLWAGIDRNTRTPNGYLSLSRGSYRKRRGAKRDCGRQNSSHDKYLLFAWEYAGWFRKFQYGHIVALTCQAATLPFDLSKAAAIP
jgi:hypothetical protein